jgi:hypothetical protein
MTRFRTLTPLRLFLAFVAVIAATNFLGCANVDSPDGYSDGLRAGQLTKFSRKGLFCKTYEGEVALGGLRAGQDGQLTANVWEFTVSDHHPDKDRIVATLDSALATGAKVEVHYVQHLGVPPCKGHTQYFAQSVRLVR